MYIISIGQLTNSWNQFDIVNMFILIIYIIWWQLYIVLLDYVIISNMDIITGDKIR